MTWITWRRYRVRMILLALYVVVLVISMFITEHAYVIAQHTFPGGTAVNNARFDDSIVAVALMALPLLIGLILGTPLVAAEFAAKTNRLAWLQGVTRTKWLLQAWLTLALPTIAVMALLSPLVQWWASRISLSAGSDGGLIQPAQMVISGIDPIALALFTLTLGMCIGIVCRRFLSPYATSVVGIGGVMVLMPTKVLSSLAPKVVVPLKSGIATFSRSPGPNPWLITTGFRRVAGFHAGPHSLSLSAAVQYCSYPNHWSQYVGNGSSKGYGACMNAHRLQMISIYQPASHYWMLQWREAGIYVALAAALLGLSVWAVRRWSA